MRHVSLTCKNHPDLRWSTKEVAWSGYYNGARNISFKGRFTGKFYSDMSGTDCEFDVAECACKSSDLILAPEDEQLRLAHESRYGK